MSNAISVKNVTKEFFKGNRPRQTLKEYFVNPFFQRQGAKFNAVDNLTFDVKAGDFFGIIGRNGSGKSTLLKMLAGILNPTEGVIETNGKIVPFLELGVGFNPELTARENIYLNGTILGMTRDEIEEKFEDIVNFAEVGEFIDTQVKNFSSGMYVRLAFAIAIQTEADIYLIDEILSVGDFSFQQKCFNLFKQLKKSGKTFIFVSHDLGAIKEFCDKVVYIRHGKLMNEGDPQEMIKDYIIHDKHGENGPINSNFTGQNTDAEGNLNVEVLDDEGTKIEACVSQQPIKIRINYNLTEKALKDELVIGFGLYRDGDGDHLMYGTNSLIEEKKVDFKSEGQVEFIIKNFPIIQGRYAISAAIHNKDNFHYVWKDKAAEFTVVRTARRDGFVNIDLNIV